MNRPIGSSEEQQLSCVTRRPGLDLRRIVHVTLTLRLNKHVNTHTRTHTQPGASCDVSGDPRAVMYDAVNQLVPAACTYKSTAGRHPASRGRTQQAPVT